MDAKLRMIEANSAYTVYIYNSFKKLLVIFPSVKTLAKLIYSNHATIVSYIKNKTLFRGEWYFSNLPFDLIDVPLISNWCSAKDLITEIINNSHIKKAIFVYSSTHITYPTGWSGCACVNEFIGKFNGVTHAQKELKISHDIIKKYALLKKPYKGYIFSYERLNKDSYSDLLFRIKYNKFQFM